MSYFNHACVVNKEEDVLNKIMNSGTKMSTIKRWWWNLFLLPSVTDNNNSRRYFSVKAINEKRAIQINKYPHSIHPYSKFRNFWNYLMSFVVAMSFGIIQHNASMCDIPGVWCYINVGFELIIIFDIYINLRSGYVDTSTFNIIFDTGKIFLKYCTTKLFFHATSAIPLQVIMFFRYGADIDCIICKTNKFTCVVLFTAGFRLIRTFDATLHLTKERSSIYITYLIRFLRIILLSYLSAIYSFKICMAVTYLHVIESGYIDSSTSLYHLLMQSVATPSSDIFFFLNELCILTISLLIPSGWFKIETHEYYLEKVKYLAMFAISHIFLTWTMLECYFLLTRIWFTEDKFNIIKRSNVSMLRKRKLPEVLVHKVNNYFTFNMSEYVTIEKYNKLLKALPSSLKNEIKFSCYSKRILRIPYFSLWPQDVIEQIVLMVKEEIYLRDDTITHLWAESDGLRIVDVGVIAFFSSNKDELYHLNDGDYFEEMSLVTDTEERKSYAVAATNCKILYLNKMKFRSFIQYYPKLFTELKTSLEKVRKDSWVDGMHI